MHSSIRDRLTTLLYFSNVLTHRNTIPQRDAEAHVAILYLHTHPGEPVELSIKAADGSIRCFTLAYAIPATKKTAY